MRIQDTFRIGSDSDEERRNASAREHPTCLRDSGSLTAWHLTASCARPVLVARHCTRGLHSSTDRRQLKVRYPALASESALSMRSCSSPLNSLCGASHIPRHIRCGMTTYQPRFFPQRHQRH